MHRHNVLGFDQLHRPQRIIRSHGEIITDGQHCKVDALLADQAHIPKQSRVTSQVDFFALTGSKQETGRITAVRTVRQTRTVQCQSKLQITEGVVITASQVLGVSYHPLAA